MLPNQAAGRFAEREHGAQAPALIHAARQIDHSRRRRTGKVPARRRQPDRRFIPCATGRRQRPDFVGERFLRALQPDRFVPLRAATGHELVMQHAGKHPAESDRVGQRWQGRPFRGCFHRIVSMSPGIPVAQGIEREGVALHDVEHPLQRRRHHALRVHEPFEVVLIKTGVNAVKSRPRLGRGFRDAARDNRARNRLAFLRAEPANGQHGVVQHEGRFPQGAWLDRDRQLGPVAGQGINANEVIAREILALAQLRITPPGLHAAPPAGGVGRLQCEQQIGADDHLDVKGTVLGADVGRMPETPLGLARCRHVRIEAAQTVELSQAFRILRHRMGEPVHDHPQKHMPLGARVGFLQVPRLAEIVDEVTGAPTPRHLAEHLRDAFARRLVRDRPVAIETDQRREMLLRARGLGGLSVIGLAEESGRAGRRAVLPDETGLLLGSLGRTVALLGQPVVDVEGMKRLGREGQRRGVLRGLVTIALGREQEAGDERTVFVAHPLPRLGSGHG